MFANKASSILKEFTIHEEDLPLKHNHNPVRHVVKGCAFCMVKGNCLSNDDFMRFIGSSEEKIR